MYKTKKFISIILATSLLTATVGALEINHEVELTPIPTVESQLSGFLLNQIGDTVDQAVAIKEEAVETTPSGDAGLMNTEPAQEEPKNNELTLELNDGRNVWYSFSEDIKYTDTNGDTKYKDTTIVPQTDLMLNLAGYTYTNGVNDFRINFSPDIGKGIFTEDDGFKIGFIPVPNSETYSQSGSKTAFLEDGVSVDSFEYPNVYGNGTILRYTAQLNTVKKDIILPSYAGQNRFAFILDTYGNTAALSEGGKTVVITDPETDEVLGELSPIYAYDSFGGTYSDDYHYTEDCYYTLALREDGRYDLEVVVSEEYLTHPDLIYPVTIDPSPLTGTSTADAGTYSGGTKTTPTSTWGGQQLMCLGYSDDYGLGRAHVKFDISSLGRLICATDAFVRFRETTGRTADVNFSAYRVTSTWTESAITWNNKPTYTDRQSSNNFSSSDDHFYYYDVISAVQRWISGTPNYGLVIVSDIETTYNNSGNEAKKKWFAFAAREYSTSSYRPYLEVTYHNLSLTTIPDGVYYIRNQNSGKYMDVASQNMASNTNVHQWSFHGGPTQQWKLSNIGNGWYNIQPLQATHLGLDVRGPSTDNLTNIQLYTFHGGNAQRFGFVAVGNGSYRIVTAVTSGDKGLSVNGRYTTDGANIHQYEYDNRYTNDHWYLEEVEFGNGGTYRQINTQNPNCFGYALFLNEEYSPTFTFLDTRFNTEAHSNTFQNFILAKAESCRRIDSYVSPISSNEYRIAIRAPLDFDNGIYYHVIYQLSDGTWAGKNSIYPSKHFGYGNPSNSPEMWDNDMYIESAGTIYFAVTL